MSTTESTPVPAATTVLISGASRGLGLAVATLLVQRGLRVAGFARALTPELQSLAEAHPDRVVCGAVDVTDQPAVEEFTADAAQRLGHSFDGLVNNAAAGEYTMFVHARPAGIEQIITTNLLAPLLLTRLFTRGLLATGGRGRAVMVSSICAHRGFAGHAVYSATKAGLEGATRSLAHEFRDRLLINCVAPGFFASELSAILDTDQVATILRRTPVKRLTRSAEVATMIATLLLDSSALTGQSIVIDGGLTA
ncbi:SDR family NAD(P)-dependent oxidoreductase [Nocardia terpenica]|uniref:SDR family oxidoreductase n=1 Tax=Nocardia terpenica TaxID=455432 RepID=A0A6G9Z3Y0_9NOCA|nr:SDR family oxidoreductase [Nocardia terpenica]QIS20238.1 SDR family oxidoreductase [Nocardia terpenica]